MARANSHGWTPSAAASLRTSMTSPRQFWSDKVPASRSMNNVVSGSRVCAWKVLPTPEGPNSATLILGLRDRRSSAVMMRRAIGSRSEEHTSELQSLMRISYAVFCLKKKKYYYYLTFSPSILLPYLVLLL